MHTNDQKRCIKNKEYLNCSKRQLEEVDLTTAKKSLSSTSSGSEWSSFFSCISLSFRFNFLLLLFLRHHYAQTPSHSKSPFATFSCPKNRNRVTWWLPSLTFLLKILRYEEISLSLSLLKFCCKTATPAVISAVTHRLESNLIRFAGSFWSSPVQASWFSPSSWCDVKIRVKKLMMVIRLTGVCECSNQKIKSIVGEETGFGGFGCCVRKKDEKSSPGIKSDSCSQLQVNYR